MRNVHSAIPVTARLTVMVVFMMVAAIAAPAFLFLWTAAEKHALTVDASAMNRGIIMRMALFHLDRLWSLHLERMRDLREGVHLRRLAGLSPLREYEIAAARAFAHLWRRFEGALLRDVLEFNRDGGAAKNARPRGPATTWTCILSDDPFKEWKLGLISTQNLGAAAMTPLILLVNLPLVLLVGLMRRLRCFRNRFRRGR